MKKYTIKDLFNLKESPIYLCGMLGFFKYLIILGIGYVFNRFGIRNSNIPSYIYYFIYFVSFAFFLVLRKKFKKTFVFICYYIFIVGYLLYGLIVSPSSFKLINSGFDYFSFLLFFPTVVIVFLEITDYSIIEKYLHFAARVLAILCILIFYVSALRRGGSGIFDYDMVLGYQSALVTIVLMASFFRKANLYDLFMSIILTVMITGMGSRGALLTIIVFSVIGIIQKFFINKKMVVKIIFGFVMLFAGLLIINFYTVIAQSLYMFLKTFNIESRTLEKLLSDNISDGTGRDALYSLIINSWNRMPIFGYGIIGDRQFLNGIYVHNLILEIITGFGLIVGPIIIITLTTVFIKALQNKNANSLVISISSYIIVALMLSGSYVTSVEFFALIGLVLGSLKGSTNKGDARDEDCMVSE